jgi:hypothetical protein
VKSRTRRQRPAASAEAAGQGAQDTAADSPSPSTPLAQPPEPQQPATHVRTEDGSQNTQAAPVSVGEPGTPSGGAYPFDQERYRVEINVSRNPRVEKLVGHRILAPDLEAYRRRENMTEYKIISLPNGDSEEKIYDADANRVMYDGFAAEVMGYRVGLEDKTPLDQWRPLTDELRALIPGSHKSQAIHTMFLANSTVRDDGEQGFVLGGVIPYIVDQEIGPGAVAPFRVTYTFRELSESERLKYEDAASTQRNIGGARQAVARVITNINAAIDCCNLITQDVEGGTVLGHTYKEWDASTLEEALQWFKDAEREPPKAWVDGRGMNVANYSGRLYFLSKISPVLRRQAVNAGVVAMRAKQRD